MTCPSTPPSPGSAHDIEITGGSPKDHATKRGAARLSTSVPAGPDGTARRRPLARPRSRGAETRSHKAVDGRLILTDSRFDPVADFPILTTPTITLSERRTQQTGRLVERVPADKVLPFVHQRYDDLSPTGK